MRFTRMFGNSALKYYLKALLKGINKCLKCIRLFESYFKSVGTVRHRNVKDLNYLLPRRAMYISVSTYIPKPGFSLIHKEN